VNANKVRIIITAMRAEGDGWRWTARFNPGGGAPNLQAEGQSKSKGTSLSAALAEAERLVRLNDQKGGAAA
jgi:hypothetical protein